MSNISYERETPVSPRLQAELLTIDCCNVCREIKDNKVPKLLCNHYICPTCYVSMKMQKKEHCMTCERVMIRRSGRGIAP